MLRVVERAMVHIYGPARRGSIGRTTESGQKRACAGRRRLRPQGVEQLPGAVGELVGGADHDWWTGTTGPSGLDGSVK
jgi:hypothetical protein